MTELKTLKDLRIEEELCEKLDAEVYLSVKKELEGIGRTYSLGNRKEDFKGFIERKLRELKQEAIKRIKACHDGCSENFRCKACKRDMWFYDITEEDLK